MGVVISVDRQTQWRDSYSSLHCFFCDFSFILIPAIIDPDQFELVQELIVQNARVAQNQDDYNRQYDEMVSRYEATKAERDALATEIRQRGIRRREFERFMTELKKLPDQVTDFSEDLWGSLVEYVTVGKDKTMVFTLLGGTEMNI